MQPRLPGARSSAALRAAGAARVAAQARSCPRPPSLNRCERAPLAEIFDRRSLLDRGRARSPGRRAPIASVSARSGRLGADPEIRVASPRPSRASSAACEDDTLPLRRRCDRLASRRRAAQFGDEIAHAPLADALRRVRRTSRRSLLERVGRLARLARALERALACARRSTCERSSRSAAACARQLAQRALRSPVLRRRASALGAFDQRFVEAHRARQRKGERLARRAEVEREGRRERLRIEAHACVAIAPRSRARRASVRSRAS